ncbi:hypothetical protein AAMO2058_001749800, partial [Amorphochlora amoebiformis]
MSEKKVVSSARDRSTSRSRKSSRRSRRRSLSNVSGVEKWLRRVFKPKKGKERLSRTPTKNMRALRKPQRHATMHIPDSPPQETNLSTTPFEITTRSAELANQRMQIRLHTPEGSFRASTTRKSPSPQRLRKRLTRLESVRLDRNMIQQLLGESGRKLMEDSDETPTSHERTSRSRGSESVGVIRILSPRGRIRKRSSMRQGLSSPRMSILGENTLVSQLSSYVCRWVLDRYKNSLMLPMQPECQTFKDTAVMIADVSGFTRMNESFAEMGEGGAEKVTKHLNEYFSSLLNIIDKHGGDCIKFAGDALIVIFKDDFKHSKPQYFNDANNSKRPLSSLETTLLRSVQAAIELSQEPPYVVGKVTLTLHTAVGFSDVYAMHLGGNDGQWEFLCAGDAFRQLHDAVDASKRGDAVVSKEVWDKLRMHCRGVPAGSGGLVKLLNVVHPVEVQSNPPLRLPPRIFPIIEHYVPIPVKEKFKDGVGDKWLAELRRATAIFINLRGLELNRDGCDSTYMVRRTNDALKRMQQIIQHNQGYLRQFCVDDKGTVLIVVFGVPPFTWENNPYRAVKTAMEIRDALEAIQVDHGIGIASGDVYVGSVGSEFRHEHAVVGDTVNTAARLSNKASLNDIWLDEKTFDKAKSRVQFEHVQHLKVKGKNKMIQVYRPVGFNRFAALEGNAVQLLGRSNEVKTFMMAVLSLKTGATSTKKGRSAFWITGDAGVGKSALVSKFYQLARAHFRAYYVAGDAVSTRDPFYAIKTLLTDVLELHGVDKKVKHERVMEAIGDSKRLKPYAFLLNKMLGVSFECTLAKLKRDKLHRFFGDVPAGNSNLKGTTQDGKRGSDSRASARSSQRASTSPPIVDPEDVDKDGKITEALVGRIIDHNRIKSGKGSVWILEDVHLYDKPSWRLLTRLRRKLLVDSIIVITSRLPEEGNTPRSQGSQANSLLDIKKEIYDFRASGGQHVPLEGLTDVKNIKVLLCQRLGCMDIEPQIVDFVYNYSKKGNPFLCVQVSRMLMAKNYLTFDRDENISSRKTMCRLGRGVDLSKIKLPTEVRTLITMRLDHLPATELLLCKLASVFGVQFDTGALFHVFRVEGGGANKFGSALMKLEKNRIISEVSSTAYRFTSPMLQEACEGTMSQELRASIHLNIAAYFEIQIHEEPEDEEIPTLDIPDVEKASLSPSGHRPSETRPPTQQVGWHCLKAALYSDSCQIEAAETALQYLSDLWNKSKVDSAAAQNQILQDACSIASRYPLALGAIHGSTDIAARTFFSLLNLRLKDRHPIGDKPKSTMSPG